MSIDSFGFNFLKLSSFLLLALAFLTTGCTSNDAQRKFEEAAFSQPEGYTETNVNGEIEEEDDDDWRIAPLYRGIIRVQTPAFPNPVNAGQDIEVELTITGVGAVDEIEVFTQDENNNFQWLASVNDPETGLQIFHLNPTDFTYTNNYQNAIGLHRVFFFDSNDNVITYGDVKIE